MLEDLKNDRITREDCCFFVPTWSTLQNLRKKKDHQNSMIPWCWCVIARNHGHIFRRMCVRRSMESFDLVCPWELPLELNPNSRCFQIFFKFFQNAYKKCFRERNSLWTPSSFVLAVWRDPSAERLPKIITNRRCSGLKKTYTSLGF